MQSIRIAAVTMNIVLGQYEQTFQHIAEFCDQAADQQVELIVFHALVIHGHCTPNTWELAEAVPNGPSVERLTALAGQFNLCVYAGMNEK